MKVQVEVDDTKYPYSYAAEYIRREFGPKDQCLLPVLGVADADKLLTGICRESGMDSRAAAVKLADLYLAKYGHLLD